MTSFINISIINNIITPIIDIITVLTLSFNKYKFSELRPAKTIELFLVILLNTGAIIPLALPSLVCLLMFFTVSLINS